MSKYNATELEGKNKAELRELCRANGIGYNGMNNEGMRAALLTVPAGAGASEAQDQIAVVGGPFVPPGDDSPGGPQDEQTVEDMHNPPAREPRVLPTLVAPPPVTVVAPQSRKIQSGRPERNGVKRPSEGTICAQIWAWCDREHDATGKANAKDLRAALPGLDDTTKTVQFYRWRKFNGIQGRV